MNPPPKGFWQRHDVRKFLPVAIGVTAFAILLLTLTLVPRRVPSYGSTASQKPPATEKASITEETVALRSRAESRSAVMKQLPRNAAVTLYGQTGLWCHVADSTGQAGFVSCRSIERNSDRNARARRADTILRFEPLTGSVASATPLLLAPFPFAPQWGEASAGASVEIFSVDHGFYAVKLPDDTLGFLASADVDLIPANPSEPALARGPSKVVTGISVSEMNASASPAPPSGDAASGAAPATPGAPPASAAAVPPEGVSSEAFSVAPAILLEKVEPVYPPAALAARLGGTVILQISIDSEGRVSNVEVKRDAPLGMTQAAAEAVSHWKYKPATGPAGPIPSMKQVKIDFRAPG